MEGINIDVMAYDDCSRNESYMVEVKSRPDAEGAAARTERNGERRKARAKWSAILYATINIQPQR